MSTRWSTIRSHDDGQSPSADVSRLLVIGFLIAALLGLLTGLAWVGWNLIKFPFAG